MLKEFVITSINSKILWFSKKRYSFLSYCLVFGTKKVKATKNNVFINVKKNAFDNLISKKGQQG